MKTPLDLFIEARDNQLKVVAGYRVAVLKAQDDLKKFRGDDDYQIAVAAIVKEYPDGIVLTRLREVLPDSVILDEAIKKLIEKKEITSEPSGKRSQLLKPVVPPPSQPAVTQTQPATPEVPSNNAPVASAAAPANSPEAATQN